jgi:hypothetical protein
VLQAALEAAPDNGEMSVGIKNTIKYWSGPPPPKKAPDSAKKKPE